MVIVYIAVFAVYLLLFLIARRKGMSLCAYLYELGSRKGLFEGKEVKQNFLLLKPGSQNAAGREHLRQYYMDKIKLFLQMIFIGNILAVLVFLSSYAKSVLVDGHYVLRNSYGNGSRETRLRAEIQEPDGRETSQEFILTVEERQYEEIMLKQLASQLTQQLPELILGENLSLEEVREDLSLMQQVQDYPFRLEWECDNYEYIGSDGHVINEELEEQGRVVCLTVRLLYKDFQAEHVIPVHLFPPVYSEEEMERKKIEELLIQQEMQKRKEDRLQLPDSINGKSLIWNEKKEENSAAIFLLLCASALIVYLLKDRELQQQAEKRNRELLMDYPRLVSRMTLYLGAGMTVRNVFHKIAYDYQREKGKGGKVRYVYEEMLLTCHELEQGVSEAAAYEHFGKRCRLIQYMKLANLLVQNLRKGSSRILDVLRQEAQIAFEDRKNRARILGEEAGTKLLFPMMLMLGIVMLLIMIPAYISFSV